MGIDDWFELRARVESKRCSGSRRWVEQISWGSSDEDTKHFFSHRKLLGGSDSGWVGVLGDGGPAAPPFVPGVLPCHPSKKSHKHISWRTKKKLDIEQEPFYFKNIQRASPIRCHQTNLHGGPSF